MEGETQAGSQASGPGDRAVGEGHHAVRMVNGEEVGSGVGLEPGDFDHRPQASQCAMVAVTECTGWDLAALPVGGRPLRRVDDPDQLGGLVDTLEDIEREERLRVVTDCDSHRRQSSLRTRSAWADACNDRSLLTMRGAAMVSRAKRATENSE